MNETEILHVLIVDDEDLIRKELRQFLERKSFFVYEASTGEEAVRTLDRETVDIVLLDIVLPDKNGVEVLKAIKDVNKNVEVIMISAHGDTSVVVEAMKEGAFDFFIKPLSIFEINSSIERTNRYLQLNRRVENLQQQYNIVSRELRKELDSIIGESEQIREVIELTLKAAESPYAPVLITGPSGSGKELIARALHFASPRKDNVFFPVNCSAIPETLMESELFGHKKGAFTGANEDKDGLFSKTDGGTLFLDEIGELSPNAQAKLLRVLEEMKFRKIGGNKDINVNIRVLAATNKNIHELIEKNQFREDLYYRLNTFEIHLPPLKERKEDIPLLVRHYMEEFARELNKPVERIEKEAMEALREYDFPGNIRELKNMVERAVILTTSGSLGFEHFAFTVVKEEKEKTEKGPSLSEKKHSVPLDLKAVDRLEKKILTRALEEARFNKTKASRVLGISRHAFHRKLMKYNLD